MGQKYNYLEIEQGRRHRKLDSDTIQVTLWLQNAVESEVPESMPQNKTSYKCFKVF